MECINSQKKYKARVGAPFKQEEAQVIGETLEKIRQKNNGELKSEVIVEEAEKKNNPLHEYFEWNNSKAAEEYRLQQARNIVNHIVEEVVVSGNVTEQKSFYSVTNAENEMVYVSLSDGLETPDYRSQLLNKIIVTLENLTITMKMFKQYISVK